MQKLIRDSHLAQHMDMIAKAHYLGFVAGFDDTVINIHVDTQSQTSFEISSASSKALLARVSFLPLYHEHSGKQCPTDVIMLMDVLDAGLICNNWCWDFGMICARAKSFIIGRNKMVENRDRHEARVIRDLTLRLVTHTIVLPQ